MPQLLKRDAIRLLHASKDFLTLALFGIAMPKDQDVRGRNSCGAAEIGLIGAAAELAMSACLVQTFGNKFLTLPNGQFKTARKILDEFRSLLKAPVPAASFLVEGIVNSDRHRKKLCESTMGFSVLISARAGSLHAGQGFARELVLISANDVSQFLDLLSKSAHMKIYLAPVPRLAEPVTEKIVLLDELLNRIKSPSSANTQARLVSSAFIVLPEIPNAEPEWLDSFEKIAISPNKHDLSVLLRTLEKAQPTVLKRRANSGKALPVRVMQDHPFALPIEPQNLRQAFTKLDDQWNADVANANGRLQQGILDLPPDEFVLELFASGFGELGGQGAEKRLKHNETWPYIASSLQVQGTPRPYWFLVRKTENLSQLKAHLNKAVQLGNPYFKRNLPELLEGISYIASGKNLPTDSGLGHKIQSDFWRSWTKLNDLQTYLEKSIGTEKAPSIKLETSLVSLMEQEITVGDVLEEIIEDEEVLPLAVRNYWAKLLAEMSIAPEDRNGLILILKTQILKSAHTTSRKQLLLIDTLMFGPACQLFLPEEIENQHTFCEDESPI